MTRLALTLLLGTVGQLAVAQAPIKLAGGVVPEAAAVTPVARVEVAAKPAVVGAELLPKALADAKAVLGKTRDYTGHLVRQERVRGKLAAETVAELRVRMEPFAIDIKTTKPLALAGEETSYVPGKNRLNVRYRAPGVEGVKGFTTVEAGGAKALANSRHPAAEYGLTAMIDRVEKLLEVEKHLQNPVAVYAAEYAIAGKPVTRFEVVAERQHAARYAHRVVLFVEVESKLPVRFEAYDTPKAIGGDGELIELQSVVGLKMNVGLGERDFDR